jgi:hypothetical protein
LFSATVNESVLAEGQIRGVVVNGSSGKERLANTPVILQAGSGGNFKIVGRTTTDYYGKFTFDELPLNPSVAYLPGVDRDGVHYPGQRVSLNQQNSFVYQEISVFDTVTVPCPLVVLRHAIDVEIEKDFARVRETLLITNPSFKTYVGQSTADGNAFTLRLAIPPNFDRVTFSDEFYGRRFRVVEHQPVTDIPWPPGDRKLTFAYRIPLQDSDGLFRRKLDAPSRQVTLLVRGDDLSAVICNLKAARRSGRELVFSSADSKLPADYVVELRLQKLPVPWMRYARSGSIVALIALMLTTAVVLRRRADVNRAAVPSG